MSMMRTDSYELFVGNRKDLAEVTRCVLDEDDVIYGVLRDYSVP